MRFSSSLVIVTGTLVSTIAVAPPLGGCSNSDATCNDYSPPASFDARAKTVSFSKDVMPIFGQSCAFASCHGSTSGSANGVFLGGSDAAAVHQAIVDVRSTKLPTMAYVTPGDPRQSFLMRKMDGSQCALDSRCTSASCGQSMPQGDDPLPLEARDTVRRWIAQGAKND